MRTLILLISLTLSSCVTYVPHSRDASQLGRVQEYNTGVVIEGSEKRGDGRIRVARIDGKAVDISSLELLASRLKPERYGVPIDVGLSELKLLGRFVFEDKVYSFQASVSIEVQALKRYVPMGAFDATAKQAWLWMVDVDANSRVTERALADFKSVQPVEVESHEDLWAALDESYNIDRGDAKFDSQREREQRDREEEDRRYRREQESDP